MFLHFSLCLSVLCFIAPNVLAVESEAEQAAEDVAFQAPSPSATDTSAELLLHALAFIGVRYQNGGTSPDTGLDCSGYVRHVFKEAIGVLLPRNAADMGERGEAVQRNKLQPGDLVFFNTLQRAFSHVGIYLGDHRFIHAPTTGKAVQISSMSSSYWSRRYDGGRRIAAARE